MLPFHDHYLTILAVLAWIAAIVTTMTAAVPLAWHSLTLVAASTATICAYIRRNHGTKLKPGQMIIEGDDYISAEDFKRAWRVYKETQSECGTPPGERDLRLLA